MFSYTSLYTHILHVMIQIYKTAKHDSNQRYSSRWKISKACSSFSVHAGCWTWWVLDDQCTVLGNIGLVLHSGSSTIKHIVQSIREWTVTLAGTGLAVWLTDVQCCVRYNPAMLWCVCVCVHVSYCPDSALIQCVYFWSGAASPDQHTFMIQSSSRYQDSEENAYSPSECYIKWPAFFFSVSHWVWYINIKCFILLQMKCLICTYLHIYILYIYTYKWILRWLLYSLAHC